MMKHMITEYNNTNEILYVDIKPRVYAIRPQTVRIEEVLMSNMYIHEDSYKEEKMTIEYDYYSTDGEEVDHFIDFEKYLSKELLKCHLLGTLVEDILMSGLCRLHDEAHSKKDCEICLDMIELEKMSLEGRSSTEVCEVSDDDDTDSCLFSLDAGEHDQTIHQDNVCIHHLEDILV